MSNLSLRDRLNSDMKKSMKEKDAIRLSTLRMIRAAIKNKEIERRAELDDNGIVDVIAAAIKQRKDSISIYLKGNRKDLADKEEDEKNILLSYLPEQVSEGVIREKTKEVIKKTNSSSMKDMGKVMKILMEEFKGKADGSLINNIVKELLNLS